MNKSKVVSHGGLVVNLAHVKCFRFSNFTSIGKKNNLIVEFNTRYDYVFNPGTKEFEKQEYSESSEIEFPDYETASSYRKEWEDIWQEYLSEQEED